jgi:hypothetical protein
MPDPYEPEPTDDDPYYDEVCECEQDWSCHLHAGQPTWLETRYDYAGEPDWAL